MDINAILLLLGLTPEQAAMIGAIFGVLFALSEALALIPAVKSNSVFQLISGILAKVAKKGAAKIALFCLVVGLSFGCSGYQEVKPLAIQKEVAVQVMTESASLYKQGKMSADDYGKVKAIYTKWRETHLFVIKGLLELSEMYDADKKFQVDEAITRIPSLVTDLVTLGKAYGIKLGGAE